MCPPLMIVSSMFVPALKAMLSKLIDDDEIGKIFGLSAFGETLCGVFGSLIFTAIYGGSVNVFAGIAFILQALFNAAIFGALFWLSRSIGELKPQTLQEGTPKDDFSGVGGGQVEYSAFEDSNPNNNNNEVDGYQPVAVDFTPAGEIPEHPAVTGDVGGESEETDSEEDFALRTPKKSSSVKYPV